MIETVKFLVKNSVADRKGATALEYALIASAVAAVVLGGFKAFFGNVTAFLGKISFTN